jgi:outer membrane protein TolC
LPIDLLRRRPDIVEAERQLAVATALIGVATADLFPHVVLIGSAGWQQGVGATAAAINPIWSVGPGAAAPLLDFGRLDAIVQKADFRSRELLFNYKQTVLNAVREVDTAVDAYAAQQDRLRHLGDALTAARRAVTLATERFDRGLTDSLNVIAAQLVTLFKSLGSGWEDYQVFPPIPPPLPAIAAAFKALFVPNAAP